ncbi:MAG: four helix bundle protein [Verrucomicrobia bacterium]|nr:four helix bundle protein [Verrucomicrobiota bacterium]
MAKQIRYHWELDVYKLSVEAAMEVFELSKSFPKVEAYSLTDQVRRSSRSVSGQIAEAWRRRKYEAVFINKLNEAEGEGAETQVWLEYAVRYGYLTAKQGRGLIKLYNRVLGKLVTMGNNPKQWVLPRRSK